ncbi:MAG: CDP-diacylglycerol--serine O-phosphatidyltransferase [Gammaproteobacteria bacterium]|nr:MAG: CDP-diacylglycerol--serine O-phosphatidyltransferase [Gammaproteobacteria bacterium]
MKKKPDNLDLYDEHEEVVSEGGKKVRRRGIYLLPNLLTTAALFAGFFSIISSIEGNFIFAGAAVFVAQMFDGLDGRVARLAKAESNFGAQYDSLCDVISFGLAPSICIFLWGLSSLGQAGWVFSFLFVAAAALRLARFNANIGTEDKFFKGLPSPVAAAVIAYYVWTMSSLGLEGDSLNYLLTVISAILTGLVSILMVINVPYYSFKEIDMKRRVPFFSILMVVFIFALISLDPPLVLLSCALLYLISGPIIWIVKTLRN